jgi:hypothetical protein
MTRKTITAATVGLMALALFASAARAQDAPSASQPVSPDTAAAQSRDERQGHHKRWEGFRNEFRETVALTDEQQPQVAEIFRQHAQAAHSYGHEHAEEIRQTFRELREARRNGDEEAAQAALAKLEEHKQFRETQKQSLLEQLGGVLDDSQMTQATELLQEHWHQQRQRRQSRVQRRNQLAESLELTDEQRAQSETIMSAAREEARNAESLEQRFEIMRQAMQNVHNEVLTDEQRTELQQLRREHSPLGRLDATDEQFEQAETIIQEAREQARQAETREQRREIMRTARERIRDEVLTDSQRTQAEKMRRQRQEQRSGQSQGRNRQNKNSQAGPDRRGQGQFGPSGQDNRREGQHRQSRRFGGSRRAGTGRAEQ